MKRVATDIRYFNGIREYRRSVFALIMFSGQSVDFLEVGIFNIICEA